MPTPQEMLASLDASMLRGSVDSRFSAKLSHSERCEVLAWYSLGVRVPVLAAAFKLHRRTVSHIVSDDSAHYKSVRAEYKAIGAEEFQRKHMTEAGHAKIRAVQEAMQAERPTDAALSGPEYKVLRAAGDHPNKRKNTHEGIHTSNDGHGFEIAWKVEGEADTTGKFVHSGWYFRALSDDLWQVGPDSLPFNSSKLAHDTAKIEVTY